MAVIEQKDVVNAYKKFASDLLRNPDDPVALVDQMALLLDNGDRANKALYECFARRAHHNAPDQVGMAFNLGSILERLGKYNEAIPLYTYCIEQNDPIWHTVAHHHLGVCWRGLGDNKQAIAWYEKAIALAPARTEELVYKKDLALALMADGQLARGLEVFECRKQLAEEKVKWNGQLVTTQKLPKDVIHWQGEPLEGKSVAVYHEEGTGDFFHFCRFIPLLRERGAAKVSLTGPVHNVLEYVADNIAIDDIVPLAGPFSCDYVVGSMSIPWRCGIEYQHINGRPYLNAQPATFPRRSLVNVGLVWHGNPKFARDADRSIPLSTLCPLFEVPNVAFYSLQIGEPARELTLLGFDGFVADLEPFAKSWRATARLIKQLDLIISVDTAAAHLAGALGVPVITMVTNACDWRWDRNSERTIWYDSMCVVRQEKTGDWAPVIARVKQMIEGIANERGQASRADRESEPSFCAAE